MTVTPVEPVATLEDDDEEGSALDLVEDWLRLTPQREMFRSCEIEDFLLDLRLLLTADG